MGRKCCAPNYNSGYKSQSKEDYVTFHKFRVEWKNKIHRSGDWDVTHHSYVVNISKTAISSTTHWILIITENENYKKSSLSNRYVKDNAYLTIFPNYAK